MSKASTTEYTKKHCHHCDAKTHHTEILFIDYMNGKKMFVRQICLECHNEQVFYRPVKDVIQFIIRGGYNEHR